MTVITESKGTIGKTVETGLRDQELQKNIEER